MMHNILEPYIAKPVDQHGFVSYSKEEDSIWSTLMRRQIDILQDRACSEYLHGLKLLKLPMNRVPQYPEINMVLHKHTQWQLAPVPSVIPVRQFFSLLADRKFPVATFIRRPEDLDYVKEPDIFHEIVGHCPLLMHPAYADFVQAYGQLSLQAAPDLQEKLGRLFFYTIETGLIATDDGLKIYGGGILSSSSESIYALDSNIPQRKPFNMYEIMQTAYGLEELQTTYYVIDSFECLYGLLEMDFEQVLAS